MTELMKRYEADFEKGLTHACYESWLETEISDNKRYIATLESNIVMYKYEIKQLKAQLIWRPVSEPPKENVDVEVCDMSKPSLDEREPVIAYYEKGEWICVFPYNFNVYAYITPTHWRYIPPAPEGE